MTCAGTRIARVSGASTAPEIVLELMVERLGRDGDGLVVHGLEHPFRDRTTECLLLGE